MRDRGRENRRRESRGERLKEVTGRKIEIDWERTCKEGEKERLQEGMDREGKREIERSNVLREREIAGGNDQKKKKDGMQETFRKEI